jgi:competence ComEA-like helix-hairpin-helix protein
MVAISLREYVREIEKQVDGGRNEEAIAHSRHVLESFPKYVDVYRLLGKAYLESQRYGDAGDIFQRVLSAVPDDFVAHVGMSIIREDEGNLDEAIWHMERAFDVQPSNSAIQEELRRLYGRRDNVEPPKIRLTRGALARMYFKGELYPQAIAELRAALSEDPDRLDLQVLLAETYAKAGQRAEAVEMCNQVLRRLPYCLTANRVMVEMLIGTERESEIQTYYERLIQLDPYAAHVSAAAPRAEDVPDQAIRLNKLDYKAVPPGEAAPGQPLWAATLGIEAAEMATGREEALPEWLAAGPSAPAEAPSAPAFTDQEAQAAVKAGAELPGIVSDEEQIPEWMKELGWVPASEETIKAEAALQIEEEEAAPPLAEGELAAAEIPEWLKAMAPAETLTQPEEAEEDVSPWIEQLFPAEAEAEKVEEEIELPPIEEQLEVPDWLAAEQPSEAGEIAPQEPETAPVIRAEAPAELGTEAVPDWLAEITPEGEIAGEEEGEELPEWLLESLAPKAEAVAEPTPAEGEAGWSLEEPGLAETLAAEEVTGEAEAEIAAGAEVAEEMPSWLFEGEAAPAEAAAEAAEELPSWLFEGEAAQAEGAAEAAEELPSWLFEGEAAPAESAAEAAEELPSWLFEGEAAPVEGAEEVAEELPGWLFEEAPAGVIEESFAEAAEPAEELPDWLKTAGVAAAGAAALGATEWMGKEESQPEAPEEALLEEEEAEAVLAEELPEWLSEPLQAEQPAAVEEQPSEAFAFEAQEIQPAPVEAEVKEPVIIPELEEALAWLDQMLTPVAEALESAETPAPAEAEAPPPSEVPSAETPMAEMPIDEDAAFAWLESLAVRQGAQEALLLKPEERLETPPEWVYQAAEEPGETPQAEAPEVVEEAPGGEPEAAATAAPTAEGMPLDEDAAFAWLESLAVRQGAQEALLLKPEERRETPPEWLQAAAEAEVKAPASISEVSAEVVEVEQAAEAETAQAELKAEGEVEEMAETVEPAPSAAEEPPELPDWLAEPVSETREEVLEWTPPPLSRRKYDLNKITLVELERLPGVGFILAQRIIDYRNTHGPFKKIDDLLNVPDFSLAALEGIRENLYLEAPAEPTPAAGRTPTQPRPGTGPLVLATGAGLPNEVVKARKHLSEGFLEDALSIYNELIRAKKHLSWVIEDLSEASNQYPTEFYLWQSLGDAYLRSDQASQALQAFIRAEKLLLQ